MRRLPLLCKLFYFLLKHLFVLRLFLFLLGLLFAARKEGDNAANDGVQKREENKEGDNAARSLKGERANAREEQKEGKERGKVVQKNANALGKRELQKRQGRDNGNGKEKNEQKAREGHGRHSKAAVCNGEENKKAEGKADAKGRRAQQKAGNCRRDGCVFHKNLRSAASGKINAYIVA